MSLKTSSIFIVRNGFFKKKKVRLDTNTTKVEFHSRRKPEKDPPWDIQSTILLLQTKMKIMIVIKEDTRTAGPWSDKDMYIPRQVRNITLYPWQVQVLEDANKKYMEHTNNKLYYMPRGQYWEINIKDIRRRARACPQFTYVRKL
jgi:hypothetical protein